jgi:hypothetical protein
VKKNSGETPSTSITFLLCASKRTALGEGLSHRTDAERSAKGALFQSPRRVTGS